MRNLALLPYLLCLAVLAACIETDVSVPGFPDMVRYFSTTEAQVQLTMSVNFFGFCLAGLFNGPLSDSFGRRTIMLLGNIIFLVGGIGTSCASSIETLIAWRFFQGMGASAAFTVVFAMIADAYQGADASKWLERINALLTAAMAAAPVLGGLLVESFGWRSTFGSVAILCFATTLLLVLFLPETLKKRQPFQPKTIARSFSMLLCSGNFWALSLIPSLLSAGYMSFVSGAVFFYTGALGLSLGNFTIHQMCVISSFSIISFLNSHISKRLGSRNALVLGIILNIGGGASMLALALLGIPSAWLMTMSMCAFAIGVALCFGVTFAASMEVFPELKGSASSLNMTVRLCIIALAITGVSHYADGTFIPETILLAGSALSASALLGLMLCTPAVRPMLLHNSTGETSFVV